MENSHARAGRYPDATATKNGQPPDRLAERAVIKLEEEIHHAQR